MRVIIAGSRHIEDYNLLLKAVEESGFKINTVVSGGAVGVDKMGERYAFENHRNLHIILPEWNRYGKSAGYIRNVRMSENADALIALWDGRSRGTKNMIEIAKAKNMPYYVKEV